MVVKSQIKLIKSLHQKKNRFTHNLFIVEGEKGVKEALANELVPYLLCATTEQIISNFKLEYGLVVEKATNQELAQMSALKNPNGLLGVFKIPTPKPLDFNKWVVVLDHVQDPGNLGTIIRLCDWFGISQILCSIETADCYNPKVVQATMGSISRIQVHYADLAATLAQVSTSIYGTFMEGTPIAKTDFSKPGLLVFGNEGKGISPEIEAVITDKISISSYGNSNAESLNVANAAAVVLYEIRRR